jgi:hypothetical protein
MTAMCTTYFNIKEIYALPIESIYVFCTIFRMNGDYFPKKLSPIYLYVMKELNFKCYLNKLHFPKS